MILHQDDDWIAVDKPTGLATHAGQPGELGVVEWLDLHLGLETHVVSRLDRGTSGVLLLARHATASARAQRVHEEAGARKIYEFWSSADALAGGPGASWIRDDPIEGKPAHTSFTRLDRTPDSFLGGLVRYRAEISRGRRHQIRRHAAASGVPILGDIDHGGQPFGRLCLHCAEVHWPDIAGPLTAATPASFRDLGAARSGELELALCRDRRGTWPGLVTDAYRLIHRDEIPGLPVSLEIFGDWFQLIGYDTDALRDITASHIEPLVANVARICGCRGGVVKTHNVDPHRRSLSVIDQVHGEPPSEAFVVSEHGLRYTIDLMRTQHSGLFLDQRDTRRRIALAAAGRRVANLFAFTCSFSVAAVAGGAEVAFSVDTAKACLRTGMANFAENDLAASRRGKFIQEDARRWLRRQLRRREGAPAKAPLLDLLICDPPVFAASKDGGQFELEQEWPELARAARRLLSDGGVAVFANNHRGGEHRYYRDELQKCFARVTELLPPLDFPRIAGRPHHVRTFWCE